jgi:hypothetical protein
MVRLHRLRGDRQARHSRSGPCLLPDRDEARPSVDRAAGTVYPEWAVCGSRTTGRKCAR